MRLLTLNSRSVPILTKNFSQKDIPRYAILSHTWGVDEDEVTFQDLENGSGKGKAGYDKILLCGEQARNDGLQYFWVDTCCIDKSSSAELSEAINSMFRWYRDAQKCYAYLDDFDRTNTLRTTNVQSDRELARYWKDEFQQCRWFARGWTLQELLAPSEVHFYSYSWRYLGSRERLSAFISAVTSISNRILVSGDYTNTSVAQRMCWASHRLTTRIEDIAYSLMGIFDVNMPILYGEGEKAFTRLQEEIIKTSDDESIFAWADPNASYASYRGMLARSPQEFSGSGNIFPTSLSMQEAPKAGISYSVTNKGLNIQLPLQRSPDSHGEYYASLNCQHGIFRWQNGAVAIRLKQFDGQKGHFARVDPYKLFHMDAKCFDHPTKGIYVRQKFTHPVVEFTNRMRGIILQGQLRNEQLRETQVWPPNSWDPKTFTLYFDPQTWKKGQIQQSRVCLQVPTVSKFLFLIVFDFNPINRSVTQSDHPWWRTSNQLPPFGLCWSAVCVDELYDISELPTEQDCRYCGKTISCDVNLRLEGDDLFLVSTLSVGTWTIEFGNQDRHPRYGKDWIKEGSFSRCAYHSGDSHLDELAEANEKPPNIRSGEVDRT